MSLIDNIGKMERIEELEKQNAKLIEAFEEILTGLESCCCREDLSYCADDVEEIAIKVLKEVKSA